MKKWLIFLVLCAGVTEVKAQRTDAGWLMEVSSRASSLSSRVESRDLSTSVEMTGSASVEMTSESVVVKEGPDWTRFAVNTAVSVGVAFGTKTVLLMFEKKLRYLVEMTKNG